MRTRTTRTAAAFVTAAALLGWLMGLGGLTTNLYAQGKPAENPSTGGSPILPVPDAPFGGVIGRKASESKSAFPRDVAAPKGAPNVLLIMTDDTGFGAASTFCGPIPTPNFDRVAKSGKPVDRHSVRDAIQSANVKTMQGVVSFDNNGDLKNKVISVFQIVHNAKYPDDDPIHQYKFIGVAPEN